MTIITKGGTYVYNRMGDTRVVARMDGDDHVRMEKGRYYECLDVTRVSLENGMSDKSKGVTIYLQDKAIVTSPFDYSVGVVEELTLP